MDLDFGPFEWHRVFIAGCGEAIDGGADFARTGGAEAAQGRPRQDAEPDLDLVEPGCVGRGVVEVDVGMAGQPAVVLGFMDVEVVQNDVELSIGIQGDNAVHEVAEVASASPSAVADVGDSGVDFQGGKQGRCAMALVLVILASQGTAVGQPQPSLCSLQSLNRRLFVHANHHGVLGRVKVKAHDVRGLLSKLRVGADAPTAAPL